MLDPGVIVLQGSGATPPPSGKVHEDVLRMGNSGPGNPTDTVRRLRNSLALQMTASRQRRGAVLYLSSTAALAFSTYTLPLVEICREGEALHWKQGLDYFRQYGLPLTVIPHWNNGDGGEEVDASCCYIGRKRFRRLHAMLPAEHPILGIDEDAALVFDFARRSCRILGTGSVTFLRNGLNRRFPAGSTFPLGLLGLWRMPDGRAGIPRPVWEQGLRAESEKGRAPVSR